MWIVPCDNGDGYLEVFGGYSKSKVRFCWSCEEQGFTPWLAENPEPLEIALDTNLHEIETEVSTGQFRADIVAENSDGERVVIENQLGTSDHAHLGKLLTYGSFFEAENLVWVAESFKKDHIRTGIKLTQQLDNTRLVLVMFVVHPVGGGHLAITFEAVW
ncbi:PDDEXK family nuclease [Halorussus halophilus]|uniref:hypothetical protein n=1 Tax=Halorussus halophilus TaxID=2650975 RepID=UPI001300F667|nr:hypothetical protein [Halorussus halophilus]